MLKQGVKSEGERGNGSRLIAGYPARRNGEIFFELTADERAVCIWQMDAANNFFPGKALLQLPLQQLWYADPPRAELYTSPGA